MKTEIIQSLVKNFESYANKTDNGVEFWLARDLQQLLGYAKWDNFLTAISKAKTACEATQQKTSDHFADVGKTIKMPKGAEKQVPDSRALADFQPTILLKAKDFATEITIFNTKNKKLQSEQSISEEHITNNRSVRKTLLSRGIVPEKLSPEEDIKKVERKLKSEEKKGFKKLEKLIR